MGKRIFIILVMAALCVGMLSPAAMAVIPSEFLEDDGQINNDDTPNNSYSVDPDITIDDLKTSTAGIDFIKAREGFLNKPYMDVSQLSIGYGCSTVYAEKYGFSTKSITEDEASQLLLCVLGEMEQALEEFLDTYHIQVNQCQYDALISFTFNVGTTWLNPSYRLASLLISGDYTDNEFAGAMGIWCHVGKEIDHSLILRRIYEIKLFLYGAYELDDTYNKFCYMIYDGNGGSPQVDIAFYLEGEPYGELFSAELSGKYFSGWYTEDGERITARSIVTDDITVYAAWSDTEEDVPVDSVDVTDVFSDIAQTDWYYTYINDLYHSGVIDGYNDGTFKPNKTVTTGEALKMIMLAAGYKEPAPVASHWARSYLNLSLEDGIIDRGEITDLDVPITRALMAKVAANSLHIGRLYDFEPFTDTTDPYVLALYDYDIATGYTDGTFLPAKSLTRAELAAIVWRIEQLS